MSEIESCTQESISKGRRRVAGAQKGARKKIITGRVKFTRKVKSHVKKA